MVTILHSNQYLGNDYSDYASVSCKKSTRMAPKYSNGRHPTRSNSSAGLHLRSQSMPETVYHQQQQQQQQQQILGIPPGQPLRVIPLAATGQHYHPRAFQRPVYCGEEFRVKPRGIHYTPGMGAPAPGGIQLRRSQTNAGDFAMIKARRQQQFLHPTHQMHSQFGLSSTSLHWAEDNRDLLMSARSRCNIASFYPPMAERDAFQLSKYQHRSLGYLSSIQEPSLPPVSTPKLSQSCRDLSQPLHVDCSIEYDLGNQPKIPKDSAPLLIIHPAFQSKRNEVSSRFHPYSSVPSSPQMTELATSTPVGNHNTPVHQQSYHPSLNPSYGGFRAPLTQSAPAKSSRLLTRHASFVVNNPANYSDIFPESAPRNPVDLKRSKTNADSVKRQLFPKTDYVTSPTCSSLSSPPQSPDQKRLTNQQVEKGSARKYSKEFHLSMPNILHTTEIMEDSNGSKFTKKKGRRKSKNRVSRKLSSESGDSGTVGSQSSGSTPMNEVGVCDSGLGTPSSGLDQDTGSAGSHRWMNSMSDLVTGFLCCSGGLQTAQFFSKRQQQQLRFLPPTPPKSSPRPLHHPPPSAPSSQWSFHTPPTSSTSPKLKSQSPYQNEDRWTFYSSSSTSSVPSPPFPDLSKTCPACLRSGLKSDCRDGFCAFVWNSRENNKQTLKNKMQMRPIQI